MKILHLFLMIFFTAYTLFASTGEYQISGTVTKKGGGPLGGVTVLLKGKKASVVTGADGTFKLTSAVAVRMSAPQTQTLSFTLRGNAVAFSPSTENLNGNVTTFSGNGRCIASTDFSNLNPSTEQITLPQLASGFNIVRVTINNTVYTCQVIQLGNELHLFNNHTSSPSDGGFTLAKSASSATVDTIVATKAGFTDVTLPVTSYTLSNVSIEMDTTVTGAIAWGKVENPTASCNVGTLPEYSELKANSKLPDPFMKLDGTRIKDKSEWACRREEIRQQLIKYVFGDKPIPAKGSVTGTVSETKISVKVQEGTKSCSYSATIDMNGATKPAPAIIIYSAPLPVPTGIAKINFTANEVSGGSGAKTGSPFFTFYGSDHPAGYLIAQAWEVSRIIDVLEQNPGIIDPTKLGVTGCSRNGKGAFICGVLDNRIALTLPVESGIGGTVGLRLIEQLGGGEWPYHAISYVRWLSEIALGKFTNANNAAGDNTDRLPVDMNCAMALIAPRGLYIMDNASTQYEGLDRNAAYVTGVVGKKAFEVLGLGDNFTYECTSGSHCDPSFRTGYKASLSAMIDKFLLGKTSTKTGNFNTDLSGKPDAKKYYDWDTTALPGNL